VSKQRYVLLGLAVVVGVLGASMSCDDAPQGVTRRTGRSSEARQDSSAVLIDTVAKTLNDLPSEVVLDLLPPEPILDDSKSSDQQPVLATLDVNPLDPEGGYSYLSVPAGNGNFRGVRVQTGDIVRYFVKYDEESAEHGGGAQASYFEIPVRRLDSNNPNNALILDRSLTAPVEEPHRIEIWRFSDRRMNEIRLRLTNYIIRRRPAIAWEPTPDESALLQLVDRANQWFRNVGEDRREWKPSPLVDSLPAELREAESIAPRINPAALREGQFDLAEVRSLQEALWHRDIAAWAKVDAYEKLEVAAALFDWTVRNIQLDESGQSGIVHQPWQALMYGHGTAQHRAWVYAELCRQQQIDIVILAFGEAWQGNEKWLTAVVSDGELYLFDPALGLPIPGADSEKIATLADVFADPELLRKLDLDVEQPYGITADDLKNVRALVVATPLQLSRRAALLQGVLQGEDFVVLAAQVDRIGTSLNSHPGISEVELWPFPYQSRLAEETIKRPQREAAAQRFIVFSQRPRLWKARVLHFQGTKPIPASQQNDPLAQPRRGHREAVTLYQSSEIRLPDEVLERLLPHERAIMTTAKSDASYWLGLLSYDLGKYEVADDWFRTRTLEAFPDGFWTTGAKYNLARTREKLDKNDEAIEILEADQSPQRHGNLLRARQLQATATSAPAGE
jgi:tetratricopeptide (TPR) repeat protein